MKSHVVGVSGESVYGEWAYCFMVMGFNAFH